MKKGRGLQPPPRNAIWREMEGVFEGLVSVHGAIIISFPEACHGVTVKSADPEK
jgi:hypothetical protein